MKLLNKINGPTDMHAISDAEAIELCGELREFITENVSCTGGHLASSLGAVELVVALNRIYYADRDRIVYDVGHQTYAHKIINGRRSRFDTLRTFGGISGFPKPYESDADAFIAGHASDSISVALGMAKARTLLGESYNVAAVIGDGSLTGGLAYEGLENVASSGEPIVIILNDNQMSINRNVGGVPLGLQKMRVSPGYYDFKKKYRSILGTDSKTYLFNHDIKESIKKKLLKSNVFIDLGFEYLGPVDGHDLKELESALEYARDMQKPVLLHVQTTKGKGYEYAERDPARFHGVGKFDVQTGETVSAGTYFCDIMGKKLSSIAELNRRVVAITAAMTDGTGLSSFSNQFPLRFFDVGIAEGHAVSMAAGMAKQGLIPVFAVYSSFLQRSYDMLIHDVSILKLHVVFCIDRAGLVGNDGETHHGTFDVAYLSSVPGMAILAPSSFSELEAMLQSAIDDYSGPVAIRYPRGGEGAYKDCSLQPETILREGSDVTIVSYGRTINNCLEACEELEKRGISAELIKLAVLKPNTFSMTADSIRKTGRLICVEDVCEEGSIGRSLLSTCAENDIELKAHALLNLGDGLVTHGAVPLLDKLMKIDAGSIADSAERITKING